MMADESEDQWLYGDSDSVTDNYTNNEQSGNDGRENSENLQESASLNDDGPYSIPEASTKVSSTKAEPSYSPAKKVSEAIASTMSLVVGMPPKLTSNGTKDQEGSNLTDSDSDDDIHVVIGDIKSIPASGYNCLNIKRSSLLTSSVPDNLKKQSGKFSIDDFETIGVINGIQAHEFNLDQLEDKPWRQPGADITDYFNYGFNEDTWRAYCERQKRMRSESGVGLVLNAGGGIGGSNPSGVRVPQVAITNDNSKYSGIMGPKRAGPPPGRKMAGTIDVIGSSGLASRRNLDKSPPKENIIQVMTADRREYSRKPAFPDMSVPPPTPGIPPTFDTPPPGYHVNDPPPYYIPESDPYYQSYEPTQDSQWGNDPTWQPTNLAIPATENVNEKDPVPKAISTMVQPTSITPLISVSPRDQRNDQLARGIIDRDRGEGDMESLGREREKGERDKDSVVRDREHDKDSISRDEDREKSRPQYRPKERHRHRSRSRSRRHKSKSRSPSRRKKKARRSDREKSKEDSE